MGRKVDQEATITAASVSAFYHIWLIVAHRLPRRGVQPSGTLVSIAEVLPSTRDTGINRHSTLASFPLYRFAGEGPGEGCATFVRNWSYFRAPPSKPVTSRFCKKIATNVMGMIEMVEMAQIFHHDVPSCPCCTAITIGSVVA